jgi:hypothetical protein
VFDCRQTTISEAPIYPRPTKTLVKRGRKFEAFSPLFYFNNVNDQSQTQFSQAFSQASKGLVISPFVGWWLLFHMGVSSLFPLSHWGSFGLSTDVLTSGD